MKPKSTWRTLALLVVTIAACGDDAAPAGPVCEDDTSLLLECPEEISYECVPRGSATLALTPLSAACDGSQVDVSCTPAAGAELQSGVTVATCTARTANAETSCTVQVRVTEAGTPMVQCVEPIRVSCVGTNTPATVLAPLVDESCGSLPMPLVSDAPSLGFLVGETPVTFSGADAEGNVASCTTTVTVFDDEAPIVDCEENVRLVRNRPGEAVAVPETTASDACEGTLLALPTQAEVSESSLVSFTATDASGNMGTCDSTVTVIEAHRARGVRVLSASLSAGATDITVGWDPAAGGGGEDLTGYAVERSTAIDGEYSRLMELDTGSRAFTDAGVRDGAVFYRVVSLAEDGDGAVTEAIPAFAISADEYSVSGVDVPTIPFPTSLFGVVRHPQDLETGPRPLAILLHGNHGNCRRPGTSSDVCAQLETHECTAPGWDTTPNAEGLTYLAETLAAQGFVAVTISGNAVNCRDVWIEQRAQLIVAHLERWRTWSSEAADPFDDKFVGAVDVGRVALFGHSRGAEGVAHVPRVLRESPRSGIALASVMSLAPTDYAAPTPLGVPFGVILPGCDGDVSGLSGMRIYDRAVAGTDGEHKAQVLFVGANHNYFNSEWTSDDNSRGRMCRVSSEVGAPAQRGMLEPTVSAWMLAHQSGEAPEAFQRSDAPTPESVEAWADASVDLRWSYTSGAMFVADFDGPGAPAANRLGGTNEFLGFSDARVCGLGTCGTRYSHERTSLRVLWSGDAQAHFALPGGDFSTASFFSFRIASTTSAANSGAGHDLRVHARDNDGREATVSLETIPHTYRARNAFTLLRTVRVPFEALSGETPDINTDELVEITIETQPATTGQVVLTDVGFEP